MVTELPCVLIVESDVLIRHPLAEYLRECGYRVFEATDADEARVLLNEDDMPPVDIVFADAGSGSNDGFSLAQWLRANLPGVEVILAGTLARATEKAGELCEEGPALTKPYEHKFVLENIRRLLAARDRNKTSI